MSPNREITASLNSAETQARYDAHLIKSRKASYSGSASSKPACCRRAGEIRSLSRLALRAYRDPKCDKFKLSVVPS